MTDSFMYTRNDVFDKNYNNMGRQEVVKRNHTNNDNEITRLWRNRCYVLTTQREDILKQAWRRGSKVVVEMLYVSILSPREFL